MSPIQVIRDKMLTLILADDTEAATQSEPVPAVPVTPCCSTHGVEPAGQATMSDPIATDPTKPSSPSPTTSDRGRSSETKPHSKVSTPSSTPTEAWSEDEDGEAERRDEEEDDFDLVSSRDLRSSRASLHGVASVPSTPPQQTHPALCSDDETHLQHHAAHDHTDTESWRSSSASDSAGEKSSASDSGRSNDGNDGGEGEEDDTKGSTMRLSFPDPIAASSSSLDQLVSPSRGRKSSPGVVDDAVHVQHDEAPPSGLGAEYSMLLDMTEEEPASGTDDSAAGGCSSARAASKTDTSSSSSVPASPISDASRQLSEMSTSSSPEKNDTSFSTTSSDSINAASVLEASRSTSPLFGLLPTTMTTSTPPSRATSQTRLRRTNANRSTSPLSRSATALRPKKQSDSLLVNNTEQGDAWSAAAPQPDLPKSFDRAQVHEWIKTAAASASARSSEPVVAAEEDSAQDSTHLAGEDELLLQQQHDQAHEHDLAISSSASQSMASSSATVVPGPKFANRFSESMHVSRSLPGAMPDVSNATEADRSTGKSVTTTKTSASEDDKGNLEDDPAMQAYAHAPGTARSRRAMAVLSFVAAAVAIAATGWLDSSSSPASLQSLPPSTVSSFAHQSSEANKMANDAMDLSETIKALIMETVGSPEAGATLITAMSIIRSDETKALAVVTETTHAVKAKEAMPSMGKDTLAEQQQQQQVEAPEPPLELPVVVHEKEPEKVFTAPANALDGIGDLVISRARRQLDRHRRRTHRRRREILSLFDRIAPPPVVQVPAPPVLHMPPAFKPRAIPRRARPIAIPVKEAKSEQQDQERQSWLSAWLQPSTLDLITRVSEEVLSSSVERGRHALEKANNGRRKLARHLQEDFAAAAKDLGRRRERLHDFTVRHRATCKRSPHLPECFLERLGDRGKSGTKSWWNALRKSVAVERKEARSLLDRLTRRPRKANKHLLDRAYSDLAPFLARQLDSIRYRTRRAQPLAYRGGEETLRHARKAAKAMKRLEERFAERWRRGGVSASNRRSDKKKSKARSRRG
ncbi:hypothetical protein JCM10908_000118 [Rhodotorula pacifica]|uniref:uncharacterized protein n=1 Tax=Rhodotorula pacifica TaxID=1495444 RepID=UPI00316B2790